MGVIAAEIVRVLWGMHLIVLASIDLDVVVAGLLVMRFIICVNNYGKDWRTWQIVFSSGSFATAGLVRL